MENIKYHQNGLGNEYGTDYRKEYCDVYFRIEASAYHYPSFSFTEEEKTAFYAEVRNALEPLGWRTERDCKSWSCNYIVNGKSRLYLHPQSFDGEVLKSDIKAIAEALQEHNTFYLRCVDLHDTVYDISDNEYEEYLSGKDEEVRKSLFEHCVTTRTSKFHYAFDICRGLAEQFRLKRIGINDGRNYGTGQTIKHIQRIMDEMIAEGLLVGTEKDGNQLVRSPNKTERKKMKNKCGMKSEISYQETNEI